MQAAEQRLLAGDAAVTPQAEKRLHSARGVIGESNRFGCLESPQTVFLQQPRIPLAESPSSTAAVQTLPAPPPSAQPAFKSACMPPCPLQLGVLQLATDGKPYLPYGLLPPPPPLPPPLPAPPPPPPPLPQCVNQDASTQVDSFDLPMSDVSSFAQNFTDAIFLPIKLKEAEECAAQWKAAALNAREEHAKLLRKLALLEDLCGIGGELEDRG